MENKETFADKVKRILDTPDYTLKMNPNDIAANKVYAVLSYFSFLVVIPILAAKKSRFAQFHANQGAVLFAVEVISSVVFGIISGFSSTVAAILSGLFSILLFLFILLGIINAIDGKAKELPIIGKFNILYTTSTKAKKPNGNNTNNNNDTQQ